MWGRQPRLGWLGAVALWLALCPARAEEPGEALPETRWEPGLLPAIGYDSDLGLGLGAIGTLARFEPGFDPYRVRLQAQAFVRLTLDPTDQVTVPYQQHYLRADLPDLIEDRLRLGFALTFAKISNTGYYGLGQRSERRLFSEAELEASEAARRYHYYDDTAPSADVTARIRLFTLGAPVRDRRLELLTGLHGAYHLIERYEGSKLAADVAQTATDPRLADLLHGTTDHGLLAASLGLLWDTRDHEFAPTHGSLTELSSRLSPGVDAELRYLRLHFATRWFVPIVSHWLVFAHRTALDLLVGDPPVYELSQYGVLQIDEGPGGTGSVRGVLLRRYHGKAKIIENVELRGEGPAFTVFGERFRVGAVGFVDAGRVWSDLPAIAALDGPWAPFAVGVGAGLRLRWGETLVMRGDGAYSPTDDTSGFYLDLGHVF